MLIIVPLLSTVVLAVCTWMIANDAQRCRRLQQRSEAELLLLTQQLDRVFQQFWDQTPVDRELDKVDQERLHTWVSYDEKFVGESLADLRTRFRRATVHRRIGQACFRLGSPPEGEDHFQQAIALFGELARDNPSVSSYVSEQADCYARLAQGLNAAGDAAGSRDACRRAAELSRPAPLPDDPVFNEQSARTLVTLGDLAARRESIDEAQTHLAQAAVLFRLLQTQYPDSGDYAEQLFRIESRLKTVGLGNP